MEYVRSFAVRDSNGVDLTLFEYWDRQFLRVIRHLKLDTGELVEEVGGELKIAATGEPLTRI